MWPQAIRHCLVRKIAFLSVPWATNGAYCEDLCLCSCGRRYEAGCAEIRVGACTEIGTITSSCL